MIFVRLFLIVYLFSFLLNSVAQIKRENNTRPENIQIAKKSDTPKPFDYKDDLCVPQYSSGCNDGDGFTDFAVEEIQNYSSGCADNMGYDGWSQYLDLGPAFLLPGNSYDFIMRSNYNNQYVSIWIDFDDDAVLTEDEKILSNFELDQSGQFYTASITIPSDASLGQHFMRARAKWNSGCDDACENYSYGEAEDYYVMIGEAAFGILEGTVTEVSGSNPVEGAIITLDGLVTYSLTSGSDGSYYKDDIMIGDYDLECFKEGYNIISTSVIIEEDVTLTQDFQLTQPEILVSPLNIEVELDQNTSAEETIAIENNGNGPMDWSASMLINSDTKDYLDLQFEYTAIGGYGVAGIESDGQYIYTTKWNSNEFLKYELDGTYIESFTIVGVSTIRDLAYDGNYFYGGNASSTIYEMDFETQTLVSVINAPTNVRALAYNESEDVFYGNNWNSPVVKFDKAGNYISEFQIGPEGNNYYGFAYDPATLGGPYLWGYAQTGNSQNQIYQMQLPSGTETGLNFDVTDKLTGQVWGAAGGLFTQPNLVFGKWTLGGIVQNERLWGLELGDAQTWLGVSPNGGTLAEGESEELTVLFDATDLEGGVYNAEIYFTTYPNVGSPVVEVTMMVNSSLYYPCNLQTELNCTNIDFSWEMCPEGAPNPESYNIYRNDEFIVNIADTTFTDPLVFPETAYVYKVSAIIDGSETVATPFEEVIVPFPENLEPENLSFEIGGDWITLNWETPDGCLIPDGYNIYQDGIFIEFTTESSYQLPAGNHEYFITSIYYFGESEPSNTIIVIISSYQNINQTDQIHIYPNPATEKLFIQSPVKINQIELLNNLGLSILNYKVNNSSYQLDVSDLSPGVYFLKMEINQEFILQKVLIQ